MTRSRVGSKYPIRMDMAFFAPIVNAVCLKGSGHNYSACLRESDQWNFWKLQVGRYATPALLTARAVLRAHRIPPGRSPSPRGVRARESEMPARTECGYRRRRAALALS